MTPSPELLVPVGSPDKLATALRYGADAVYLGGQSLSLRAKSDGFSFLELENAVKETHRHGAKVYFTLNLLAWEEHLRDVERYLEEIDACNVDGIIIADPGIVAMARKRIPHIPIHLSTQANTSNSASAMFWRDQGVRRVNVARELGAGRIRAMAQKVRDLELEVFVHGAMCMAISGRCLLSAHLNQRSGNLGMCTHPCRFDYKITAVRLEERLRPGHDMWEVCEDEQYSQIMGAQDLCLIKYLRWFRQVGIHSLKIEGRMKTPSYLAQVTDIYRTALNDLEQGAFRPALYLEELQQLGTRPLSTGFFTPERITLCPALPKNIKKNIVAKLIEPVRPGLWLMDVKCRFQVGDPLEIVLPGLRRPLLASGDYGVEKEEGFHLSTAHSGLRLLLHCDHPELEPGIFLRAHLPDAHNGQGS
ncbi:MAG: peptidase U32 family protein [Desulfomicrobium apsheronum]|jgi:putative protease|nr:peptidase U32 family protein [Desulfomicrobium apsheronum]